MESIEPMDSIDSMDSMKLVSLEGFGDSDKIICLEGSTTDKATVNVGVGEKFLGVAGLAAAAIKDAGLVSYFFAVFLSNEATDEGVNFLSLFGSGGFASTNGPDGFVSNDDIGKLLSGEMEKAVGDLFFDNIELTVGFAFL